MKVIYSCSYKINSTRRFLMKKQQQLISPALENQSHLTTHNVSYFFLPEESQILILIILEIIYLFYITTDHSFFSFINIFIRCLFTCVNTNFHLTQVSTEWWDFWPCRENRFNFVRNQQADLESICVVYILNSSVQEFHLLVFSLVIVTLNGFLAMQLYM